MARNPLRKKRKVTLADVHGSLTAQITNTTQDTREWLQERLQILLNATDRIETAIDELRREHSE